MHNVKINNNKGAAVGIMTCVYQQVPNYFTGVWKIQEIPEKLFEKPSTLFSQLLEKVSHRIRNKLWFQIL